MMIDTQMDEIDTVLTDWYAWSQSYQPVAGYKGADSSCRDFQISRQWMGYEELSEQVDRDLLEITGKAVEPIVLALDTRYRIAVMTAARNFNAGSNSFTNPRYPDTQAEDYAAAKLIVRPALLAKGLIQKS